MNDDTNVRVDGDLTSRPVPTCSLSSEPREENAMKHVRLGRSNLQVSRIAFGTWQLGGEWGATVDEVPVGGPSPETV